MKFRTGDIVCAKQQFSPEYPTIVIAGDKPSSQVHVSFFPKNQTAYLRKKNVQRFDVPTAHAFIKKKGIREAVEFAAEYAYSLKERYPELIPFFDDLLGGEYHFIPDPRSQLACSEVGTSRPTSSHAMTIRPPSADPAQLFISGQLEDSDDGESSSNDGAPCPEQTEPNTMRGQCPFTVTQPSSDDSEEEASVNDPDYIGSGDELSITAPPPSKFQRPKLGEGEWQQTMSDVVQQAKDFQEGAISAVAGLVLENIITRIEQAEKPKLTRKRQRRETTKEARKRLKNSGSAYITKKGIAVPQRAFKIVECKCPYDCRAIPEDTLKSIFETFWAGSYAEQQAFLVKHVSKEPVKRRRVKSTTPKKNFTLQYTLTVGGRPVRVCRNVFQGTLAITESRVQHLMMREEVQQGATPEDKRGKHPCPFKTPESKLDEVRSFLRNLPASDSHYRRSDSTRKYLQPGLSIKELHKEYSSGVGDPVGLKIFSNVFNNEFNFSFEPPRKDVCDQCHAFSIAPDDHKQLMQTDHDSHLRRMKQAFSSKKQDTAIALVDPSTVVATFDMEKILVTPCTPVSNMHYKRKLSTYNFTVWNNATKRVTCYVWNQTGGKKGSAETSTALFQYLQSLDGSVRRVIFYSDTAGGQNRNRALVAMYSHFLATTTSSIESIEHKYMESGHSHMEVDSAHSSIERASKNRNIYVPEDWATIMAERGYTVVQPTIDEWLDFPGLADAILRNRKRTLGGDVINWLKLKTMLYSKKDPDAFYVKYEIDDINYLQVPFDMAPTRQSRALLSRAPNPAYTVSAIPVPKLKLRDLMQMAEKYVPAPHRGFYQDLVAADEEEDGEEDL